MRLPMVMRQKTFNDYWPLAMAVQLLTTALFGFAAWMNWQAYQDRKALRLEIEEMRQRVAAFERQTDTQTMLQPLKEPVR